jgi:hypothetical protein
MSIDTEPDVTATVGERRRRWPLAAAALLLVVVAVAGVLLRSGAPTAPYDDAAATGRLTLCSGAGDPVTHGTVGDRPFAAAVVGSSAPPTGTSGAEAVLFAYQPRQGVAASGWTGLQLDAGTAVSGSTVSARLAEGDTTLRQFLGGYPAQWDGWVQLRLIVSDADGARTQSYDTVDLHIDGDSWTVSDPGTATCPAGP